jgi:spoIIIJ-associated protein
MENWETLMKNLIERMGFADFKVEVDEEHHHGAVVIYDNLNLVKENLPALIESANHIVQLVAKKNGVQAIHFDINNYRRERETLITELARTAARKVIATARELSLPAMNSYERRLVHMELMAHPEVTTESVGSGHERYVIIRPLAEVKVETKTVE